MGNQQCHTYVTSGSRNEPLCHTYVIPGSERVKEKQDSLLYFSLDKLFCIFEFYNNV